MAGYYKMSRLKNCINKLKNIKNINDYNNNLGKKISELCTRSSTLKDTIGINTKIKVVNEIINKEIMSTISRTKNSSNVAFNSFNESFLNCKSKLEESCKALQSIPNSLEEKKIQYKSKYFKSKQIRREAEKLCKYISTSRVYGNTLKWTAAGALVSESKMNAIDLNSAIEATTPGSILADTIPEPPPLPDLEAEALSKLNALGESTFASLGLGGWSPVGILQNCLEYLHVSLGLEWWAVIAIGTVIIRTLLFPLVIIAQRNAARMNNYMPQMQTLQLKMTEARQAGDALNAARYGQEMMLFMKEKGLNPFKNMMVPFAQAPIFLSFFISLRQMANVPVESLTHGGLFWFTDLTLPDQFFILPILTSATLWLTIEIGTDSAKLSAQNMVVMKYVLRALPLVILPFTVNFPGAILCYWASSNLISLVQVAFLRIPKVRTYFNIEPMLTFKPEDLPVKPKGFKEGLKESWTNVKITKELEERRRLDEMQFQKAGKGPIQKTFKFDPTKQSKPLTGVSISAKKR